MQMRVAREARTSSSGGPIRSTEVGVPDELRHGLALVDLGFTVLGEKAQARLEFMGDHETRVHALLAQKALQGDPRADAVGIRVDVGEKDGRPRSLQQRLETAIGAALPDHNVRIPGPGGSGPSGGT
jgi:hypothetical protein